MATCAKILLPHLLLLPTFSSARKILRRSSGSRNKCMGHESSVTKLITTSLQNKFQNQRQLVNQVSRYQISIIIGIVFKLYIAYILIHGLNYRLIRVSNIIPSLFKNIILHFSIDFCNCSLLVDRVPVMNFQRVRVEIWSSCMEYAESQFFVSRFIMGSSHRRIPDSLLVHG